MKKTLLSILALTAGVAFAQNPGAAFKTAKAEMIKPTAAKFNNSIFADKANDTTVLYMQGGACSQNGALTFETMSYGDASVTYTEIEQFQKLSFTTGGKVLATLATIPLKKVGAANGTSKYVMYIYDVDTDGYPNNLLGTSLEVDYADIDTSAANDATTFFFFATPVTVPSEFFVGIELVGAAAIDTIYPIGSTAYDATKTGLAQYFGDCSNGTSGYFVTDGSDLYVALHNESTYIQNDPTSYLDPKLALGAILEYDNETTSIVDNNTISYSIFPNPTSDVLNVQYTLATEGTVTMNVVDLTGRVVRNIVKENQGAFQATEQINIAGLNAGIYLLNVTANGNTTTQKFIVK